MNKGQYHSVISHKTVELKNEEDNIIKVEVMIYAAKAVPSFSDPDGVDISHNGVAIVSPELGGVIADKLFPAEGELLKPTDEQVAFFEKITAINEFYAFADEVNAESKRQSRNIIEL